MVCWLVHLRGLLSPHTLQRWEFWSLMNDFVTSVGSPPQPPSVFSPASTLSCLPGHTSHLSFLSCYLSILPLWISDLSSSTSCPECTSSSHFPFLYSSLHPAPQSLCLPLSFSLISGWSEYPHIIFCFASFTIVLCYSPFVPFIYICLQLQSAFLIVSCLLSSVKYLTHRCHLRMGHVPTAFQKQLKNNLGKTCNTEKAHLHPSFLIICSEHQMFYNRISSDRYQLVARLKHSILVHYYASQYHWIMK